MKLAPLSLYARTMVLVGGVTSILFGMLIFRLYGDESSEYESALQTRMGLQANLLAASSAQAMWDFNIRYVESTVQGVLADREIDAVTVRDVEGKVVVQATDAEAKSARNFTLRRPIRYLSGGKEEQIGELEISVSRKLIDQQLLRYLEQTILQGVGFLAVQLFLLHLVLRYLLRPIGFITETMHALAEGRTDMIIPSQSRSDEIGRMARAIQIFKNTAVQAEALQKEVVARRTLQAELERAKEQAEASNLAKSQFLANMSHEIRTPMNGVLGMVHLLADTAPSDVQREYIQTINHSAKNLLLLLNDILDLSKIEAHELILERTPFDVRQAFLESVNLFRPLAKFKDVAIVVTVAPGVPEAVKGDPGRFAQIVTNLVGNAVKFTEAGAVTVNLGYENETVTCHVRDTGIGIARDKQASIFEKFTQGDASITRKYGGTGLGLTITRQLVVMMGGEIGFESTVGEGAAFHFTLPAPPGDLLADIHETMCEVERERILAKNVRVLIVEDHPVNQIFLAKLLRKFGFQNIDAAENGLEALEKFSNSHYDVVFMDCQMPLMDGYEATREIRKREEIRTLIIAMTANVMHGDREACFDAGMDEYVSKPLDPDKLKNLLSRWFILPWEEVGVPAALRQEAPIDIARLRLIAETEEEAREVLALFFDSTEEKLKIMGYSRREQETKHWKEAAHYLKGASLNLGMTVLSELCREAEQATLSYSDASVLLTHIEEEIVTIRDFCNTSGLVA